MKKQTQSPRTYGSTVGKDVERVMKKRNAGTLRSGGASARVTSRKQAIAIGLSEARAKGKKVPKARSAARAS